MKIEYQKNIYIPLFIAALFKITKIGKQPKCPSTDKQTKKMWYVYTGMLFSVRKKEILPQYCKVISLQLNKFKKEKNIYDSCQELRDWGDVEKDELETGRLMSSVDLMYSIVITVHKRVLYVSELLTAWFSNILTTIKRSDSCMIW